MLLGRPKHVTCREIVFDLKQHGGVVVIMIKTVYTLPRKGVAKDMPGYTLMFEDIRFLADK